MEASAIKQHLRVSGGVRSRTPLLRMQSDERLVSLIRRGNHAAFGALVSRYEARLLAFCRHLLRSREDAEDVLQEVFASAFKAMMADDRPIRVRPWLYRIARNRCLNHLRRISAIGVDSIEDHFSEHGPSTSDMVQRREDLWQLVGDIQELPESQRSALLLREMEALSYEQIADVLDKTIPSVKSLLIRARRSLAESAEARSLTCQEARAELDEVQAGLRERPSRVVRRHIASCQRCAELLGPESQAEPSLSGLRVWLPLGPAYLLKKLWLSPLIHSARAGSTATAAGASAAAGPSFLAGSTTAGFISAGVGGLAGKAAVGLTAAALGLAGAVVVDTSATKTGRPTIGSRQVSNRSRLAAPAAIAYVPSTGPGVRRDTTRARSDRAAADRPSSSDRTTTRRTPGTPAPTVPSHKTKAGRSQTHAAATTMPGIATDATADPTLTPAATTSTTSPAASGSGGAPIGPTAATPTTPSTPTNPAPSPSRPILPAARPTPATARPTPPSRSPTDASSTPAPDPPPADKQPTGGAAPRP